MSRSPSPARPPRSRRMPARRRALTAVILSALAVPIGIAHDPARAAVGHLVISEVATGGATASDELIELYNPSASALPLEGLEVVYVTASGTTVSRRAAWGVGAPAVPPGGHVLVANELGVFAAVADARFAGGMAATGGSVALRIQGAASAIDAAGWGAAASPWLEGTPAPAPPAGSSLERLPGGAAGSGTDTDDNAADFAVSAVPGPQNLGSPPVPAPSATSVPSVEPTAAPTADPEPLPTPPPSLAPSPTPTVTPSPAAISVAAARAVADGTTVTITATAVTDSAFSDGGGFLADGTGGIAVLLDAGSFARGDRLTVTGVVDDRFAQRTLRADDTVLAAGGDLVEITSRATGGIDESVEGRLVRISGAVDGSPTELAGGLAFDVDDGSGAIRVVVGTSTGVDTAAWTDGRLLVLVGVVGQRDSSGSGTAGYRVQPRDPADVESSAAPASPSPSAGASTPPGEAPSPSSTPGSSAVSTIAEARSAARNAEVTVRGVVTLASGTVEEGSAVIQDASGGILLRISEDVGAPAVGELVEVGGVRSSKGGMESIRVSDAPRRLGTAAAPAPRALRTGEAGEAAEAQLVVVRGALIANARRASSGSVSLDLDDGSGPLRVGFGASIGADDDVLVRGSWVELVGVLGQETSGAEPLAGYRVWPRGLADLTILAAATDGTDVDGDGGQDGDLGDSGGASSSGGSADDPASLEALSGGPLGDLRVGATLVAPAWEELGLGGLLWDGRLLVGVASSSADELATLTATRPLPISLDLGHLDPAGVHPRLGITLVALGTGEGDVREAPTRPARPRGGLPGRRDPAAWVSVVGVTTGDMLNADGRPARLERACSTDERLPSGPVAVTGVALSSPTRIIVPCGGIRPAPSLALAAAMLATDPSAGPIARRPDGAATMPRTERPAAVGLLAVGVLVLLLAAALRLRFGVLRQPAEPASSDPEAPAARLTLLPVPRERGP